jgi:hypothetical protein
LAGVAGSNTPVDVDRWNLLQLALHDRLAVDLGPAAWVLLLGCTLAVLRGDHALRQLTLWALASAALLLGAGLANGHLQSYHLRILTLPMVLVGVAGFASIGPGRWRLAALLPGACAHSLVGAPVVGDAGAVDRHAHMATSLLSEPGPLCPVTGWISGRKPVEASGVVLDALLRGMPEASLGCGPEVPRLAYLSRQGELPVTVRLADLAALDAWAASQSSAVLIGGARDWGRAIRR